MSFDSITAGLGPVIPAGWIVFGARYLLKTPSCFHRLLPAQSLRLDLLFLTCRMEAGARARAQTTFRDSSTLLIVSLSRKDRMRSSLEGITGG